MTERLYYDDAYRVDFSGTVLDVREDARGFLVQMDRSAFYPTSGGQPYDTGTLGGAQVLDVFVDPAGEVIHLLDRALTPGQVACGHVDWARRFDHMQQHAGEHMLAGVLYTVLGGHTIGLHLGEDVSTIDVELPGGQMRVSRATLDEIEERVNRQIQQDLPIRCWFPTEQELLDAPVRKPPTVKTHIRLVQVGDVECVACGGTHPSATGQIGLIKVLDARPSRGKMRVTFVCGLRATRDYQARFHACEDACASLSTGVPALPEAVLKVLKRLHEAERALKGLQMQGALAQAEALLSRATRLSDGWRAVCAVLDELDQAALVELGTHLAQSGRTYALLSSGEADARLVFCASPEARVPMGALLSRVVKPLGGKGGGRADLAQGAGPGRASLQAALSLLELPGI
ncbi:MAG: DHHA1 domain-containing protein [Clostridia bacterium]